METYIIKHRSELWRLLPKNFISVEVGVAEAFYSAEILSWGAKKHYMVDAWQTLVQSGDGSNPQKWHDQNYYAAMGRVAKYDEKVIVLRGLTTEMAKHIPDDSLDLVYVDACHTKECVHADIKAYWPKLKENGIMAFHDYLAKEYGVYDAVNEFADWHRLKVNLIPEHKDEDAGAWFVKS